MIDIRKLKELVRLMVSNELTEIDLRDAEEQVTLRRQSTAVMPQVVIPAGSPALAMAGAPVASASRAGGTAVLEDDGTEDDSDLVAIKSPMVGTCYLAPSPDAAPFVAIGKAIGADTTVCIIEAMKIFNEIKAETGGVVEKILIKNGQPVEFGQPILLLRPE